MCHQPLVANWRLRDLIGVAPVRLATICSRCAAKFTRIDPETACPGCGRAASPALCQDCQRWQAQGVTLLHHRGVYAYTPVMKAVIYQFKGLGDYRLARVFADLQPPGQPGDALVPLTSEPSHLAARGFDPVLALFGHWRLQVVLAKGDLSVPQAQKNRAARLTTPQSFTVVGPLPKARRIILLDDLYTTGRTLYHAQAALRAAGYAGEIRSFSLIR